jgi:hypothetical protein
MSVKPKDLVSYHCYGYDGIGIVVERDHPDSRWIRQQRNPDVAAIQASEMWWKVLPVKGGALILPDVFAEFLREPTYDDFIEAVDHANEHGRRTLAALFPDFVRRALAAATTTEH